MSLRPITYLHFILFFRSWLRLTTEIIMLTCRLNVFDFVNPTRRLSAYVCFCDSIFKTYVQCVFSKKKFKRPEVNKKKIRTKTLPMFDAYQIQNYHKERKSEKKCLMSRLENQLWIYHNNKTIRCRKRVNQID